MIPKKMCNITTRNSDYPFLTVTRNYNFDNVLIKSIYTNISLPTQYPSIKFRLMAFNEKVCMFKVSIIT